MSTKMRVLKRLGVAVAMAGIAAGALAASDDAGNTGSTDAAAPATQSGAPDGGNPGGGSDARGGHGGYAYHRGDGGGREHPGRDHRDREGWQHHGWHGHRQMMRRGRMMARRAPGMMLNLGMLAAFRQLDLTPGQRDQVRAILLNERATALQQRAAEQQARAAQSGQQNLTVLLNPGDPNYARTLQQLKSRATDHVQQAFQRASDTQQKLYSVLTAQQKAQLPKVLSDLAARRQQRLSMRMGPRHGAFGSPSPQGPQGQPQQ